MGDKRKMNEEHTLSLEELGEIKTVKVYNQAYVDKQQKCIETLERENAELIETIRKGTFCGDWNDDVHMCQMYLKHEELQMYIHKLTKAKEIIQHFVDECKMCRAYPEKYKMWYQEIEEAEQFLKEE